MPASRRAALSLGLLLASISGAAAQPLRMVVLQGDPVPNAPGSMIGGLIGQALINAGGRVAFFATLPGPAGGGVLSDVGGVHVIASSGQTAPGSGGLTFATFSNPQIGLADTGAVSFVSAVNGGRPGAVGVWAEFFGALNQTALDNTPAPSSPPGTYIMMGGIPFCAANTGRLAFTCRFDATGTGFTYAAVFSGFPGAIGLHARQDAPPSNIGFTNFGFPQSNSEGVLCILANYVDPSLRSGIFTGATGGLAPTATSNGPAPDPNGQPLPGDVRFVNFGFYSVNASNAVAFGANLAPGPNPSGLFIFDSQGRRMIAAVNRQVPGEPAGVVFSNIGTPLMSDNGDVLFLATLFGPGVNSTNAAAIFRYRGLSLSTVTRGGRPVPGMAPGTILILHPATSVAANGKGQVAFVAATEPSSGDVVFATDPAGHLVAVYRSTDPVEVRPGMRRSFSGFAPVRVSAGNDGNPRSFNQAGQIALTASANIPPGEPPGQSGRAIVVLTVPSCYANCDGSAGPPSLNVNDYVCFQARFAAQDAYADCDNSNSLNVNDFICFQGAFAAGCL